MPKEANCSLCCVCRSISSKLVDGKDIFPVFGSCWEYCAQLWAHQYKENIDLKELMEQDQLRDCIMCCMRKSWENGFMQKKLRGDLNAVDNYEMGGYSYLVGKKQMGTLFKVLSTKVMDFTQVTIWNSAVWYKLYIFFSINMIKQWKKNPERLWVRHLQRLKRFKTH